MEAGQQQNQEVGVLAALAHQLVQDVGDDQESYQQAFGTRSICLPAVTCRLRLPSICQQQPNLFVLPLLSQQHLD